MSGLFDAPAPARLPREERVVLTVSQLNHLAQGLLESGLASVWVEGEISNLRRYPSGHTYFTLKDDAAQIAAVLFRGHGALLPFRPEDGLKVQARGRISLYTPRGTYQILVETLQPAGLGALQLAFEQLKSRLRDEGLFDAARKRPLPLLPRCVGVVASLSGAALHDVLQVLGRRFAGMSVVVAPARVQGPGAAADVAEALRLLNRLARIDVILVARGGGSLEDLMPFNEEKVARAIAASAAPVVSAIGHETDVTIADLVADLRAPTPSAAAEMVVASRDELGRRVAALRGRLIASATLRVARLRHDLADAGAGRALELARARLRHAALSLDDAAHRLRARADRAAARAAHRLAVLSERLTPRSLQERLGGRRVAVVSLERMLRTAAAGGLQRRRAVLGGAAERLGALSPLAVLGRGYAICRLGPGGAIVKNSGAVAPGDAVHIRLHRGALGCEVKEVEHGESQEER